MALLSPTNGAVVGGNLLISGTAAITLASRRSRSNSIAAPG